ncbi:MAG: ABC transporter ATP-binding protein [Simkaniaceae bacterium]|nr:ABC transporter ATP-binding protein [Simkaniaceae bacterium]
MKQFFSRFLFFNSPHVTALFLGEKNCFVPRIILIVLMSFISALAEGGAFGLLMLSFTVISNATPLSIPFFSHIPFIHELKTESLFSLLIIGAIVIQSIKSLLSYINSQIATNLALNMQTKAQFKLYKTIFDFDFATINRYKVGELTNLTRIPATIFQSYLTTIKELILNICIILTYFILMTTISFPLTLITLLSAGAILYIQKFFTRVIRAESTQASLAIQDFLSQTTENLHGIRTIFTFNRQDEALKRSKTNLEQIASCAQTISRWTNAAISMNEILSILLVGSLLIISYFILQSTHQSTLSVITAFMAITYRLATRLPMINSNILSFSSGRGDCLLLNQLLNTQGKSFRSTAGLPFTHFNHSIVFNHLSFTYPHTEQPILKDISFCIEKSNIVAIVGHSGAGKSTLIDLLTGLYAPSTGQILIDGINIQTYANDSWRSHLGIVSQDVFIFNSSIADNIRYGKLEASPEEIISAAKQAGAHSFITALKEGYNTLVGEKGYTLSGGEKQRIALARTLLRDPEILILDEATSNLDSESERIIQDSINEFHHKKTLIIIAHRLSTIKKADQIIVLDQGRVVEQGSHFSLLELQGKYSKFWNLQTMHS